MCVCVCVFVFVSVSVSPTFVVASETPVVAALLSPVQVWDKWPSGEVSRVGAAWLPLERITAEHRCGAEGSMRRPANFRIPVQFDADAPEVSAVHCPPPVEYNNLVVAAPLPFLLLLLLLLSSS